MASFEQAKRSFEFNKSIQPRLAEICEPLKLLGISNFGYVKISKDHKSFRISNHDDYTDKWYNLEVYNQAATINRLLENQSEGESANTKCYLWNTDQNLLTQVRREVNMWNGASIYINRGDCVESWAFGGTIEDTALPNFIVNNLDVFKRFFNYFRSSAKDIIDTSDTSKLIDMNMGYSQTALASNKALSEFLSRISINKHFIGRDNQHFLLSSRELQCLIHKEQGLSAKEMARVMGISHRTVESYFENIKVKSGLGNINQVLSICRDEGLI